MKTSAILNDYSAHPALSAIGALLANDRLQQIQLKGLQGSSMALIASLLYQRLGLKFVYVLNDLEEAGYFFHDMVRLCGDEHVCFLPSSYRRAIKYGQIDAGNEIMRTEVLSRIAGHDSMVVVTYPDALAEKVISDKVLAENTLTVCKGERIDLQFLWDILNQYGFEQVDYVYEPGQFAVRGSIVDVYSYSSDVPFRIDFFGDEVESLRCFSVETQLSESNVERVTIVPALYEREKSGIPFFDFIEKDWVIAFRDSEWCRERVAGINREVLQTPVVEVGEKQGDLNEKLVSVEDYVLALQGFSQIEFSSKSIVSQASVEFKMSPQPSFRKNFEMVCDMLQSHLEEGYRIYISSDNPKQIERIRNIFEDKGRDIPFEAIEGTLHEGFIDNDLRRIYFTDHQLFDRFHKYTLRTEKIRAGKMALSLKDLSEFHIGDYVVHTDHGIGQFRGLVRTEINGKMQEVIKLTFKDDDILFVSIHSLHRLSKYKGKEGEPPRISKLGTGAWERMKERTKSKVKDIARELIKLYSQRKTEKGFAYSPDSFMQHELEASFIYEDTPDQSKATMEVKRDMERPVPMDRLVCGDVGFGKTEVAVRAAFKAVADNKQVAVLVPTTVLALQHFQTFSERLKDFPCTIDYLSRARTASQIRKIKNDLADGSLNILIGTQRIIGKDISFKDLGLLIIDEEQKFGVSIKEKLRQLKVNVDTLTMSATPIPRTLQFSMMGARDLSVIATPPLNRYPVQTELHTFNEELIREAISFELSRNGQVLFVHNRVQDIGEVKHLIEKTVPDARVAVGHGQMDPAVLEKLILDFINQEYDVLVATTIIESGIDIPNVNTIFIDRAHNFGLSDLHQLRGRVGRSNKRSFCYLLAPPLSVLSDEARRRLQAIESFSELGSGLQIAMQDLDIRGAGNMLGAEQSGFIADIGYETYQKILAEAVSELKQEEGETDSEDRSADSSVWLAPECQIESDMELLFPETYITGSTERITLYRELDGLQSEKEIEAFEMRLRDRFGDMPKEAEDLIRAMYLRLYARRLGIEKVVLKMGKMYFYFISHSNTSYFSSDLFGRFIAYMQQHPKMARLQEKNGKRFLLFTSITTANEACAVAKAIWETVC